MSIQPTYHGGPAWLANKLGYFRELCLDATLPVYASGAPQVNEISKWSLGSAGSPPNIQGWKEGVLRTVGITNDESATSALVANADGIASWASIVAAGTLGEDTKITVSPYSTGEMVVEKCLKKYNVSFDPLINFDYNSTQAGVLASLSDPYGNNFGSLWAPTLYSAVETWGPESVICSGIDAGANVIGGIMVPNETNEENTETAALAIAAYLKGIEFFKRNPVQAKAYLNEFYEEQGLPPLSPESLDLEFSRPLYNLQEQLDMLAKNEESLSTLGMYSQETIDFMFGSGIIPLRLDAEIYIDDRYMKWIAANETLFEWTMTLEESAPVYPGDAGAAAPIPSAPNYRRLAVPIVLVIAVLNYMFICHSNSKRGRRRRPLLPNVLS